MEAQKLARECKPKYARHRTSCATQTSPSPDGIDRGQSLSNHLRFQGSLSTLRALGATMTIKLTRRTALIAFSACVAPVRAQPSLTNKLKPDALEFAELEKPAVFDVASISGSLKETIQKGQELVWLKKERPTDRTFQLNKISVGLMRSQVGDQVTMTFSSDILSFGYRTFEEANLHVIIRTKGGAALHTVALNVWVECTDKIQTLHPQTQEIPKGIAANVFANASSVEIADHVEPNFLGLKVRRCG
jgi:hypothetical protein